MVIVNIVYRLQNLRLSRQFRVIIIEVSGPNFPKKGILRGKNLRKQFSNSKSAALNTS